MLINKRGINLLKKLTLRKLNRNKIKYITQIIEISNDTIITDMLNYLKIKHITDDSINSYMYILLYEFINVSILMKMNDKKDHSIIIENGYLHIFSYIILKSIYYNISKHLSI